MDALSATHDVNWFKGVAEYAHVYVFWNEDKLHTEAVYGKVNCKICKKRRT